MNFEILEGSVRNLLPMLPSDHFQTCVTSPPYWSLRDYGTGQWSGGDPSCTHSVKAPSSIAKGEISKGIDTSNHSHQHEGWKGGICGRCGAVKADDQIGLEGSFEDYLRSMVEVFRELRRTMRPDGTLWLNMGDSYAGYLGNYNPSGTGGRRLKSTERYKRRAYEGEMIQRRPPTSFLQPGVKPKDLMGQPWALAFALRDDGWYLRSDIIWSKPNPMPESIKDRPTKAHEYLFLLAKGPRYYYDAEAIKEEVVEATVKRITQPNFDNQLGGPKDPRNGGVESQNRSARKGVENLKKAFDQQNTRKPAGLAIGKDHSVLSWATEGRQGCRSSAAAEFPAAASRDENRRRGGMRNASKTDHVDGHLRLSDNRDSMREETGRHDYLYPKRNKRSVWEIPTQAFPEAHFATFPEDLVRPCVLAGSRPGDLVLDPFSGSGTTGLVSCGIGRKFVGIELNPEYCEMSRRRIGGPLFAGVE